MILSVSSIKKHHQHNITTVTPCHAFWRRATRDTP